MSVIAIDIGTSTLKAGLYSREGNLYTSLALPSLACGNGPADDCDAEVWVRDSLSLLRKLSAISCESLTHDPVSCICVSGNGPSLVAVDKDGKSLFPVLMWMDRRAKDEALEVSGHCGIKIDPSFYLPKALWILRRQPRLAEDIAYFLPCPEFLCFRLCHVACAVLPDPVYGPYLWTDELLRLCQAPAEKFPPLVEPGKILGKIDPQLAHQTGLPFQCLVIAGLPDFLSAQIGSAVLKPGLALDRTGSSEALNLCATKPFIDSRLLSLPHAVKGLWNISGGVSSSGSAVAWLEKLFKKNDSPSPIFEHVHELEELGVGSAGLIFLPYLAGERAPLWDPDLRGAFLNLNLSHGREHMSRALLESICFGLKEVCDMLENNGFPLSAIHMSGGNSANQFWTQMKADVLGKPIQEAAGPEAELAGAAALAFVSIGAFPSIQDAARAVYRPGRLTLPDMERHKQYAEIYHTFLELRERIRHVKDNP